MVFGLFHYVFDLFLYLFDANIEKDFSWHCFCFSAFNFPFLLINQASLWNSNKKLSEYKIIHKKSIIMFLNSIEINAKNLFVFFSIFFPILVLHVVTKFYIKKKSWILIRNMFNIKIMILRVFAIDLIHYHKKCKLFNYFRKS